MFLDGTADWPALWTFPPVGEAGVRSLYQCVRGSRWGPPLLGSLSCDLGTAGWCKLTT